MIIYDINGETINVDGMGIPTGSITRYKANQQYDIIYIHTYIHYIYIYSGGSEKKIQIKKNKTLGSLKKYCLFHLNLVVG